MTTKFPSKKSALERGIFYARGKVDLKVENLKKLDLDIEQIFGPIEAEVYELENSEGKKCMIGTAPFRDGFDLWLISLEGPAIRV